MKSKLGLRAAYMRLKNCTIFTNYNAIITLDANGKGLTIERRTATIEKLCDLLVAANKEHRLPVLVKWYKLKTREARSKSK